MTCPSCQHRFRLKLREYVSVRNRHRCPKCGRFLKLKLTVSYFGVLFVWIALVAGVPFFLSRSAFTGYSIPAVIFVSCFILFGLPVDFLMQSYWLKSKEIEHEKDA
jgi:hypothetical protein